MTNECQRWVELSDRAAMQEDMSESERGFLEEHSSGCSTCAAEQRVWDELAACLKGEDPVHQGNTSGQKPALLPLSGGQRRSRAAFLWAGWVVGGVAAAVALALVYFGGAFSDDAPQARRAPQVQSENLRAFAQILLVSGDVALEGSRPTAGASLGEADAIATRDGRVCLSHGEGTTTCLEEESGGRILEARAGTQRMELKGGSLFCRQSPGLSGAPFEVKTRWGTLVGLGAEFRMAYEADETVTVALFSGKLSFRDANGAAREFSESSSLRLSDVGISILAVHPVASESGVQALSRLWAQASLTPVFLSSEPEGALLTIDGVESGRTPLSMMLSRGSHRLEVALAGFEQQLPALEVKGAERITETFALLPIELPEEKKVSPDLGPAALLARAQASRKQGQYSEAARSYQMILSRFPSSSEAAATRLSLGELQLSKLGAPEAALNSFRQYLAARGALRQEASYGEIRALRALGRNAEARSLARKFTVSYPQSGQAVSLRRWLESSEDSPAK